MRCAPARAHPSLCVSQPDPVLRTGEKVQWCVLLLLPDQQGCLQRRFPPGQFSFPPSSLPCRALHNHRYRRVRRGGGGTHRISLQGGPRVTAACTPAWSPAISPPGIKPSCGAQGASLARAAGIAGPKLGCPVPALSLFRRTVDSWRYSKATWMWLCASSS